MSFVLAVTLPDDASARGRGGSGRGFSHGGGHHYPAARARVFIAPALVAPAFYPRYYPAPVYYAPPPVYYVPGLPPAYIEQYNGAPQPQSQYMYYCPNVGAFYPEVQQCPGGWQRMLQQQPLG